MTVTHLAVTLITTVGDSTVPCSIKAGLISPCTSKSSSFVTWCNICILPSRSPSMKRRDDFTNRFVAKVILTM